MAALSSSPIACPFAALRRPLVAAQIKSQYNDVLKAWPEPKQNLPFVYSPRYNITFFGIEKLHPFDSAKFSKIVAALQHGGLVSASQLVVPLEASLEVLMDVHTEQYLTKMHTSSWTVAQAGDRAAGTGVYAQLATALASVGLGRLKDAYHRTVGNSWHDQVTPMKYHVSGTIAAAGLAMQHGWAINLGGGMHHAYSSAGMGWCPFDDIYLAVRRLRKASEGQVNKVLYIDLDAHQGNGVARDKLQHDDDDLFVLDMYNAGVFPRDDDAKAGININVELSSGVTGKVYLAKLQVALEKAAQEFQPDLVFYNAGTDILEGDPLGRMAVDEASVIARDEAVWRFAAERVQAPIVMTLSGGYAKRSAAVVIDSLTNLVSKFSLTAPQEEAKEV